MDCFQTVLHINYKSHYLYCELCHLSWFLPPLVSLHDIRPWGISPDGGCFISLHWCIQVHASFKSCRHTVVQNAHILIMYLVCNRMITLLNTRCSVSWIRHSPVSMFIKNCWEMTERLTDSEIMKSYIGLCSRLWPLDNAWRVMIPSQIYDLMMMISNIKIFGNQKM